VRSRLTDPRTGAIHAVQRLLKTSGAPVQAQPSGGVAYHQDQRERSAVNIVAGQAVREKALANKTSLFFGRIPCLRAALAFEHSNSLAGARIKHLELKNRLCTAVTGRSRVRLIFGKYFVLEISVHDTASPLRASRPSS
jgi:hypothetical protein